MSPIDIEDIGPDEWLHLQSVLDQVIDLPDDQRPEAVNRLCGGDAALRSRVEALLAADRGCADFLTTPVLEMAGALLTGDFDSMAEEPGAEGKRVGPYRILREIGRGGMGRVYLAERVEGQFQQSVAIKLLKRGLDTDEILARFLQERQILARLEHPNIARLLDGGATEEGLPWFALELVEGTPITEFAPAYAGPPRDMLRFFLQACRAVEYAHRNLVIHRDLKPSNILVSRGGEVKLLDFGIAKVLDPGDRADLTASAVHILTPTYASPEQIRGLSPTTATDVYALGVVLYEMITGERPYRSITRGFDQVRKAILEEIPERPSTRLRRKPSTDPASGRDGWGRAVRGDLDSIVEKAIRKEPEERYPTAEALAEDLERYLGGYPVRASGRRSTYVAKKFVQRNRVSIAAASLLLLSLAGGLVASAWQARVAAQERDRALLEAKKATEIKDFTLGLFRVADPSESRGASVTALDLLERGTDRANRELAGQPALRTEMLTLLANVYRELGAYSRAESLAQSSVVLARGTSGPRSEPLAAALHWLGITRRERGDFAGAKASFKEALAIRRARVGERSRPYAETLGELAGVYRQAGELDSAEVAYRRALEIDRAVLGPSGELEIATDLDNLGVLLTDLEKNPEALAALREASAIRERKLGPIHPLTANSLSNMAFSLKELGRYPEADSLFSEAIRIRLKTLGPEHIDLATSYANRAELKRETGDYSAATPLYEQALAIERKALPPDHPDIGRDVNNLAVLYYQRGLYPLALDRFREALASRKKALPPDDRGTLTMEHNIGCVLRGMGRYTEAERILRDVRVRRERTLGPDHIDISNSDHHLGILLHLTGRDAEAERRLRRALAMRDTLAGHEHPLTAQTSEALATLLRDEGRYAESLPLYRRAVAINSKVFQQPSPQSAEALVGLGRLLLKVGKPAEAEGHLRSALAIRRRVLGTGEPRTAEAAVSLALCRASLGSTDEAESLLAPALPVLRRQPGRVDPLLGEGARALDRIRRASNRPS